MTRICQWALVMSVCCLLDGCNCRVTISNKKEPKDAPTAKTRTFTLKLPGRTAKVTADESAHVKGEKGAATLSFSGQTLVITSTAISWNGQEVSKLTSGMTALDVKILKKTLTIAAGETVLFETGF